LEEDDDEDPTTGAFYGILISVLLWAAISTIIWYFFLK